MTLISLPQSVTNPCQSAKEVYPVRAGMDHPHRFTHYSSLLLFIMRQCSPVYTHSLRAMSFGPYLTYVLKVSTIVYNNPDVGNKCVLMERQVHWHGDDVIGVTPV
jgi:hypothetical protein